MSCFLQRDPIWLNIFPTRDHGEIATANLLIAGDGQQVEVPAPFLLAVSPFERKIVADQSPSASIPCLLSFPDTTVEVLQMVREILTTGTAASEHLDMGRGGQVHL